MTATKKLFRVTVFDEWDGPRQFPNSDTYYETEEAATKAAKDWEANYPDSLVEPGHTKKSWINTWVEETNIIIIGGSVG